VQAIIVPRAEVLTARFYVLVRFAFAFALIAISRSHSFSGR